MAAYYRAVWQYTARAQTASSLSEAYEYEDADGNRFRIAPLDDRRPLEELLQRGRRWEAYIVASYSSGCVLKCAQKRTADACYLDTPAARGLPEATDALIPDGRLASVGHEQQGVPSERARRAAPSCAGGDMGLPVPRSAPSGGRHREGLAHPVPSSIRVHDFETSSKLSTRLRRARP
jgi:hypothetical protein